jgi:formylglycine-generating enzyme
MERRQSARRRARSRVFSRALVAGLLVPASAHAADPAVDAAGEVLTLDLGGTPLVLRRVPSGNFSQGSAASEIGHEPDENPREVTLTHDYWLGAYPVTRGQFARFVVEARYVTDAEQSQNGGFGWDGERLVQKREHSWRTPGFAQTDDHPVVVVTYADATAFAAWASRKTGRRVRLPTEAEWEYAARGGTTTPWYAGTTEEDALTAGWFLPNAGDGTRPVGQKAPNAFGLFDMGGNVYEWCRDLYEPYGADAAIDPEVVARTGPEPERRVLRGGSWLTPPTAGRIAARHRAPPASRTAETGFRVAVSAEDGVIPGAPGGGPDFARAAPLGLDAEEVRSPREATHDPDDGGTRSTSWSLVLAPLAAAAAAVGWMLLRRRA